MQYDWSYTWAAMPSLLRGAGVTLLLALVSLCFSLVIAVGLTILRASRRRVLRGAVIGWISFIRGTPLLIQIFLVYYVLPAVGIDFGPLTAAILALSLNSSCFVAEIIRGGISAIPKSQLEAARSLGLPNWLVWSKIVAPQVLNISLPPLVNEFTLVVKSTPLVSVITVVELMRSAQQIFNANYRPFEVLVGAAAIYFVLNFSFSRITALLEQRSVVKTA
jgi:polar amino acid transport system permease protein